MNEPINVQVAAGQRVLEIYWDLATNQPRISYQSPPLPTSAQHAVSGAVYEGTRFVKYEWPTAQLQPAVTWGDNAVAEGAGAKL